MSHSKNRRSTIHRSYLHRSYLPRSLLGTAESAFPRTRLSNQFSWHNGGAGDGNMGLMPFNQPATTRACGENPGELQTAAASYQMQVFNCRPLHDPMAVTRKSCQVRRPRREGGRAKAPAESEQLVDRDRACSVLGYVWHCRLFLAATSGKAAARAALPSSRKNQRSCLHPAGWRTEPHSQP